MRQNEKPYTEQRSSERVPLPTDPPVYLETIFDRAAVSMLVENLSSGGALLMCPDVCESLETGQCLRNGILVLPEGVSAGINVIVRWKLWPRVGVQFDGITPKAAHQIEELLGSTRSHAR
jgi:hypothetical protein